MRSSLESLSGEKSLWKVTKKVLRQEICGDDGFRYQSQRIQ